ncbi:nitroreductase [Proteiniborus sp. DW1]|uniref:NADPH-dependent oxidoreductase n=1 Tax=Proteiniborus sp. DW1 TaxID=1889883 RepID=UPI00092E1176|nr:NADPH-dependent oxidoreductase [Proteiniborus sp. DW1]SCG82465.1 nitroreductase [Proteiniborus sp. DW1]
MNEVIRTFMDHRSIRSYKEEMIRDEELDAIIRAAQAAPSSINGQQVSIIAVKDKERKAKIAEFAGGQKWIDEAPVILIFASDFYRAKLAAEKNGVELVITEDLESIMVGCVDVGLAMGNAIGAAESLGLGIVPIGGVRNNPKKIIELLELPKYVYPICGLCVGYPNDKSELKPRLPKEAVYHEEKYNSDLREIIDSYDEEMSQYMRKRTNDKSDRNWSQGIAQTYSTIYFPNVSPTIKEQGYENKY